MVPLTLQAQERVRQVIRPGDVAVDATAGNGHDTLFLALSVGPAGRVYAVDRQPAAVTSTRTRLEQAGCLAQVRLIEGDHSRMDTSIPDEDQGGVAAVMFNLGYLPGGDRELVTRRESTLQALNQALRLLRPDRGVLTVIAYPGHPGGEEEAIAVRDWFARLDAHRFRSGAVFEPRRRRPPELFFTEIIPADATSDGESDARPWAF